MTLHRKDAKRDRNEAEICAYLTDMGIGFTRISEPGVPDLAIYHRGVIKYIEVKMPGKRLNELQVEFHRRMRDEAIPCFVVTDFDSLMEALGA